MTPDQLQIAELLMARGPMLRRAIMEQTGMGYSRAADALDWLQSAGLVKRTPGKHATHGHTFQPLFYLLREAIDKAKQPPDAPEKAAIALQAAFGSRPVEPVGARVVRGVLTRP